MPYATFVMGLEFALYSTYLLNNCCPNVDYQIAENTGKQKMEMLWIYGDDEPTL